MNCDKLFKKSCHCVKTFNSELQNKFFFFSFVRVVFGLRQHTNNNIVFLLIFYVFFISLSSLLLEWLNFRLAQKHKITQQKCEYCENSFETIDQNVWCVFFFFITLVENYMFPRNEMMKPMSIDVSSDSESVFKCCYRLRKTHAHPTEQRREWEVEEERRKKNWS